jgi:hypothetical protein
VCVEIVIHFGSPFNNPTETYRYYSLPFCQEHSSEEVEQEEAENENVPIDVPTRREKQLGAIRHGQRLGESIVGDRRETSPYEVSFKDSVDWRLLCKRTFNEAELIKFKDAIHYTYFFELFVEDLPMWGDIGNVVNEDMLLGEVEGYKTLLFPHLRFILGYNSDQIVAVKVSTDINRKVDITKTEAPITIKFSYSVEWYDKSDMPWKLRHSAYSDSRFLPSSFEIHWLSIINSFVLVLLLTAFLTIILLRVLKNDFSRYMELDDDTLEEEEVRSTMQYHK